MKLEFLKSLVLIFGVSAVVVFVLGRLRIPSIVGFLIGGVILGPHGFQFIKDVHEVNLLAEIGVILLMFTIGLEFSLRNLMALRSQVFGGGVVQIALTVLAVTAMSLFLLNQRINAAVFDGFLVALSSYKGAGIHCSLFINRSCNYKTLRPAHIQTFLRQQDEGYDTNCYRVYNPYTGGHFP
jgi:CPA2 family monovalent cation:H+ antiporter-2